MADQLVLDVYGLTGRFPKSELFGLTSQMRRAAASIPMNLAEGAARAGAKEFAHFINMAIGSCEEVRYQLHLAEALGYIPRSEQHAGKAPRNRQPPAVVRVRSCRLRGRQP